MQKIFLLIINNRAYLQSILFAMVLESAHNMSLTSIDFLFI